MSNREIELRIVTPEKEIFSGSVHQLMAPAVYGYVGIFPGHTNYITVLTIGEISFMNGGQNEGVAVSSGIMEVNGDRVTILADVAELAESIELTRAEQALERARARIEGRKVGDWDLHRAQGALHRALNRINIAAKYDNN